MNTKLFASALLAAVASTLSLSASAATFAFKQPLSNPGASDNSRCTGTTCAAVARVMLDIQQAKAGTGATGTGGTGTGGSSNAEIAEAQALVARMTYDARLEAWSVSTQFNCGTGNSTCDGLVQIGSYNQAMAGGAWGFRTVNLKVQAMAQSSPAVCAAATGFGATCNGYVVSFTMSFGDVVSSNTPALLADTAEALHP